MDDVMISKAIVHLTHTDILSDARILKELQAIGGAFPSIKCYGFGLAPMSSSEACKQHSQLNNVHLENVRLKSKSWRRFPAPLRYVCNYFELFGKFFCCEEEKAGYNTLP